MASKHEYADRGSIRNIMVVVMRMSSRGAVLVDHRVANLYQGMVCTIYHCNLHATFVCLSCQWCWHCTYLSAACEEAHIS